MPRSTIEKSEETRTRIVDVAYHLFVDNGYSATSMRNISQDAGVTVGALYNHFPTKEAIWVEVITKYHPYHQVFPVIKDAQGETIADSVRSAARGMIDALRERPDLLNLMFIEIVEFKAQHIPELYEGILPILLDIDDIYKDKSGRLRDIPNSILVRSFAGLLISYYITGLLAGDLAGVKNDDLSLSQVVDVLLFGVLADDDPARTTAKEETSPVQTTSSSFIKE